MSILPKEVFKYQSAQEAFVNESNEYFCVDQSDKYWNRKYETIAIPGKKTCECGKEVEFVMEIKNEKKTLKVDNGIYLPIVDAKLNYKACSDEAMPACNIVKALFIESIKLISWTNIPSVLFTLISKKQRNKAIESFNRIAFRTLRTDILKDIYLSDFAKSLHYVIFTFLLNCDIIEEQADKFAEIIVHLIEYDNAYRLRVEDVFRESSSDRWNSPRKEVKRLINIFLERETQGKYKTPIKYKKFGELLSWAFLIPKVKNAAKQAFTTADFQSLGYDICDAYWALMRTDYNYFGLTFEERIKKAESLGWTYPEANKK